MNIQIQNRLGLEALSQKPFPANTAVVSVCNFDSDYVKLKYKPELFLQLKFDDVGEEIFEEFEKPLSKIEQKMVLQRYHCMSTAQAFQIADFFFEAMQKNIETIICQCEYGQSRSVAIAAAIDEYLNHRGLVYFTDEKYYPQKTVFKKVFAAIKARAVKC